VQDKVGLSQSTAVLNVFSEYIDDDDPSSAPGKSGGNGRSELPVFNFLN
jgi:hypothetical protein